MSTKMDEDDWKHTLAVFRACLPRRGRKAEDDRRFLEALHFFTWRRSLRRASLRNPARYRARHSAARRHLRQRLRQQGQPGRSESARHRSGHPAQGERKEQASLLRTHPLQSPRTHRAGRRTAQALQARRAPLRKDRTKLQINRQLRRRPLLDQIRPHGLVQRSQDRPVLKKGMVEQPYAVQLPSNTKGSAV